MFTNFFSSGLFDLEVVKHRHGWDDYALWWGGPRLVFLIGLLGRINALKYPFVITQLALKYPFVITKLRLKYVFVMTPCLCVQQSQPRCVGPRPPPPCTTPATTWVCPLQLRSPAASTPAPPTCRHSRPPSTTPVPRRAQVFSENEPARGKISDSFFRNYWFSGFWFFLKLLEIGTIYVFYM